MLEVIITILTVGKKLYKPKIKDFSWAHQRIKVKKQASTLKSREISKHREIESRSLSLERSCWSHTSKNTSWYYWHIDGDCAQTRVKWESPWGHTSVEGLPLWVLSPRHSQGAYCKVPNQNHLMSLAVEGKWNILQYLQSVFHLKDQLSKEKIFSRDLSHLWERAFLWLQPSLTFLPLLR